MTHMDLEDVKPKRSKRSKRSKRMSSSNKVVLGATSVVSLFGIGSTLASNITLNGGGNVEFGQGVAHQVACSKNGFSITPLEEFDNKRNVHRVTGLHISGLDLTPVNSNWDASGSGYESSTEAQARLDHPGEYFNTTTHEWTPTCDGVVLDFQMYTNQSQYLPFTYNQSELDAGRSATNQTGFNSPLLWNQYLHADGSLNYGANIDDAVAVKYVTDGAYYETNYGVINSTYHSNIELGYIYDVNGSTLGHSLNTSVPSNSSFDVTIDSGNWYDGHARCWGYDVNGDWSYGICSVSRDNYAPIAPAISAITVESMNYFPASARYIDHTNPGAAGIKP
jgi:hypothetical protein